MRKYMNIMIILAIYFFASQMGVARADTSLPYGIPGANIVSADNVVTLSPSTVPAVEVHRRRYRYSTGYYPYYSYGFYPYYGYGYSSPYYRYSYRSYPYRYYYRPYVYSW